jgi:hypothetical protein
MIRVSYRFSRGIAIHHDIDVMLPGSDPADLRRHARGTRPATASSMLPVETALAADDVLAPLRRGRGKAALVSDLTRMGVAEADAWALARAGTLVLLGEQLLDGEAPMLGGEVLTEAHELLSATIAGLRPAVRSAG